MYSELTPSITRAIREDRKLVLFACIVVGGFGVALLIAAIFARGSVAARATAAALGVAALLGVFLLWRHFSRRLSLLADALTTRRSEVIRIKARVGAHRHVTVGGFGATLRDKTFCTGNFHLVMKDGTAAILRVSNVDSEELAKAREDLQSMYRGVFWEPDEPL